MFGNEYFGITHFGVNYFGPEDSGSPTPSTDPFGDVRHSAFGDRVRRSSAWFVIFLTLWVG